MKKTKQLALTLAILATSFAQAQWSSKGKITGNGNVITQQKTTASYDGIAVTGFFDVVLVEGKEGNITIKGEENLLEYINISVENNQLKIASEKNKYISPSKGKEIIITVPFESISKVAMTGSGDVTTKNPIESKSFQVQLTGSGDMNLDVRASNIDVTLTGSGDINLSGSTAEITTVLSGSGDIDTSKLKAQTADATVSGSGDTTVYCTEIIRARVSGSGDIQYKGDPKKKDTKVNGSGSISKA